MEFSLIWNILAGTNAFLVTGIGCIVTSWEYILSTLIVNKLWKIFHGTFIIWQVANCSKFLTDLFVGQLRLCGVDDAPVAVEGDDDDGEGRKVDGEAGRSLYLQDKSCKKITEVQIYDQQLF